MNIHCQLDRGTRHVQLDRTQQLWRSLGRGRTLPTRQGMDQGDGHAAVRMT